METTHPTIGLGLAETSADNGATAPAAPAKRVPPPDDGTDLSATEILAKVPLKRERHFCEPLGRWITVQEAPAAAKDEILSKMITIVDGVQTTNPKGFDINYAMVGWVDKAGNRLFQREEGRKK